MGPIGIGTAVAAGTDRLLAGAPDHPLIESSQRVSDGRKLQRDADSSFRRAEGGAGGPEGGSGAAAQDGEGSVGGATASSPTARAEPSADR
jgi:hypothetical protein